MTAVLPGWLDAELRADPIRYVDVGARGGWQRKWKEYSAHTIFVGVEPDSEECARLRATAEANEHFLDRGLYHTPGEVTLYHCDPPSRTSIYEPDPAAMQRIFGNANATRVVRRESIAVTTFDRAIEPLDIGTIDCVKIDTQGSELDILRGAENALAGPMIAVEVEVEFAPIYRGQPLFHDLTKFLHERRFELIDFPSTFSAAQIRFGHRGAAGYRGLADFVDNWSSLVRPRGGLRGGQRLVYADAIFVREPDVYVEVIRSRPNARSLAARGFTSLCILSYDDQAAELAGYVRDAGIWSATEQASAIEFVDAGARTWQRAADDLRRAGRRLMHRLQHLGSRDR